MAGGEDEPVARARQVLQRPSQWGAVGEWRAAARQAGRLLDWSVRTSASEQFLLLPDNRRREDLTLAERNLEDLRTAAARDRLSWMQLPPDRR